MSPATHRMSLGDDGTLDTVIVCQCGAEFRFNFDGDGDETYDDFIAWALDDAAVQHETEMDPEYDA